MKKILVGLFVFCITLLPVQAMDYQLKELIPVGTETTIRTDHFIYKDFYYNEKQEKGKNYFVFKGIKNLTDEEKPISITIAFMDKNKENIGVLNYCSTNDKESGSVLKSKEEKGYAIEITDNYLADKTTVKDIKYVVVMGDNINCNSSVYLDSVGRRVEDIGRTDPNIFQNKDVGLMKIVYIVVGVLLVLLFLYKFMFTSAYQNMDGDDVRAGYKKYNKELKDEREYQERVNPKVEPEPVKEKSDEVLKQEEAAQNEDKSGTDLHNMYK